jgi:uncharacterized protein DUF6602
MALAAKRLWAEYTEIQRAHSGEKGRAREVAVVTELLNTFLPKKLAVATGEVVATDGSTSAQHDILIYDALETPVFNSSGESVVVPVEGVYAVIEVSSMLDRRKLREDAEKIARLKAMPKASDTAYYRNDTVIVHQFNLYGGEYRDFPIMGFCFAYESASLDTITDELRALDGSTRIDRRVDMICSLKSGCVVNGVAAEGTVKDLDGYPGPNTQRIAITPEPGTQGGGSLMFFYLLGLGTVSQAWTRPIRLVPYREVE